MAKTIREYKGKIYRDESRKKIKDKKFFGHTSGSHSRGIEDVKVEDGKIIRAKSDRAPIKGIDFIKYGWPVENRGKKTIENMRHEKEKINQRRFD